MPDHRGHRAVAQRPYEPQRVSDHVEDAEGAEVAVVVAVPARGAPVASLVGGDHVKPGRRDRQHHLPPAVRELREAVQEQDAWPVPALEARLQDVHRETVDVVHEAGTDSGRENGLIISSHVGHVHLGWLCERQRRRV